MAIFQALSKALSNINRDVGIRGAEPRKGNFQWLAGTPSKKVLKPITINALTLKQLSNTDPITWAIKQARKAQVTQTEWDIVRDTEEIEAEINRWQETVFNNMNPWGFSEIFEPSVLDRETFLRAQVDVKNILLTQGVTRETQRRQLKFYFESLKRKIGHEADHHARIVKRLFEKPNDSDCRTFRSFVELLLEDILTFDAGVIVKNKNHRGELAELYLVPGHEIKIYRNPDRTFPRAPEPAYCWEESGVLRAEYTKDEICYVMMNPQHNGYGMSPLEVAAYIITASLYADEYNIDFFKHSNVPPAVFSLGKNFTVEQKKSFENQWDNEVKGRGLHRMMFLAGSEDPKYIPLAAQTARDMQMMEYLKWTLSVKCACYQISPQDISFTQDLHRSTAETQKEITKSRGIKTILSLLETNFNNEIVKKEFPWKDVKFQWQGIDLTDEKVQSDIDNVDITNGVISRNERRKRLGLPIVEGGDTILVTVGGQVVPIEELKQEEDFSETPTPMEAGAQAPAGTPIAEAGEAQGTQTPGQPGGITPKTASLVVGEDKMPPIEVKTSETTKIAKVMQSLAAGGFADEEVSIKIG